MLKKTIIMTMLASATMLAHAEKSSSVKTEKNDEIAGVLKPSYAEGSSFKKTEKGIAGAELDFEKFNEPMSRFVQDDPESLFPYLQLKVTKSPRLTVMPDKKIKFLVKRGSLVSNAKALMLHTEGGIIWRDKAFPDSLRLDNDFHLYGADVLEILDQMIAPFYPTQGVIATYSPNNIVALLIGATKK